MASTSTNESWPKLRAHLQLQNIASASDLLASYTVPGPSDRCPPGLSIVHEAYWRALQARQQAIARYDALKLELDHHTVRSSEQTTQHNASRKSIAVEYLPQLQQQELLRKLGVVEKAVVSISKDDPSNVSVEEHTKAKAGEMPPPPAAPTQATGRDAAIDDRIFELKKAVLAAKHTIEGHHEMQAEHKLNGTTDIDVETQVYALQQARNALITWIEEKLSIIGDAQAAKARLSESSAVAGEEEAPIPVSTAEIRQIYEQYVNARRSLLQTLQHPSAQELNQLGSTELSKPAYPTRPADESGALAANVLPYIARLSRLKQDEVAMAQQMVFAKQQLELAEAETTQLLRRLADESLLVQPGSDHGKAWSAASKASASSVAGYVTDRLKVAHRRLDEVDDVLRGIERLSTLPPPNSA